MFRHRQKMEEHKYQNNPESMLNTPWLTLQFLENKKRLIKKPKDLEKDVKHPPAILDSYILDRVTGSMIGMAIGDALGAHVEFRPYEYLCAHPVSDLEGGGTWGLKKGQFTDDTSMALCLACSLVSTGRFDLYDQLVRYKWWYKHGYMSSTGQCFDIGNATRDSLEEFEHRQYQLVTTCGIPVEDIDKLQNEQILNSFNCYCSEQGVAGNGALMRLAPVPLFFYRSPAHAVEYSGQSGQITHGDIKAYDACRYYGALIAAVLQGATKEELLDNNFYIKQKGWFGNKPLCPEIRSIAEGSYKRKGGYKDGIRGKGYIVNALEAALWAFWSDEDSFEKGALAAVNLGDDTDTTAAIYGQLAGAYYGYGELPEHWVKHVYARKFMLNLSMWIVYKGDQWTPPEASMVTQHNKPVIDGAMRNKVIIPTVEQKTSGRAAADRQTSRGAHPLNPREQQRLAESRQNYDWNNRNYGCISPREVSTETESIPMGASTNKEAYAHDRKWKKTDPNEPVVITHNQSKLHNVNPRSQVKNGDTNTTASSSTRSTDPSWKPNSESYGPASVVHPLRPGSGRFGSHSQSSKFAATGAGHTTGTGSYNTLMSGYPLMPTNPTYGERFASERLWENAQSIQPPSGGSMVENERITSAYITRMNKPFHNQYSSTETNTRRTKK